jgi:hypothetical protein
MDLVVGCTLCGYDGIERLEVADPWNSVILFDNNDNYGYDTLDWNENERAGLFHGVSAIDKKSSNIILCIDIPKSLYHFVDDNHF